jgi:hypothetical protein
VRLRKRPPEPAFAEPPPDHAGTPSPEVAAVAYEPALVPPLELMRTEGIDVLEDWFRWAEEWSMLLRAYGDLGDRSRVPEIGCGLGPRVGLRLARDPLPGMWSGAFHSWVGSQDVLVLEHTETAAPR